MPICSAWEFNPECCSGLPDDLDDYLLDRMQMVSTELLWAASGRRYGPCPVTIRPCVRRCLDASLPFPYKDSNGEWRNFSACGCIGDCSCTELSEIVLDGPVASIEEVLIDGVPFTDWRLDRVGSGWRLLRTDGGFWPDCSDHIADCDEVGAFCVTYNQGLPLDEAAIAANSELTCELVKACIPGCDCRLPRNIVVKTTEGVSVSFDLAKSWIRALPLVAAWLDAVNPSGLSSPSTVFSPDIPHQRVSG